MLRTVAAERVDRLRVVAHDRQASAAGLQREKDRRLEAVCILVFVDHDMIEAPADVVGESAVGDHLCPIEQEVVVIEDALFLLGFDVGGEQFLQLSGPA
jgi:hypothetical protein